MKKTLLFTLFVLVCLGGFSQGIHFEENLSLNDALAKAGSENKSIFIDFFTPWCAPCKMMAKEVFPQKATGDFYNRHFINLSLNADAEENKQIIDQFVITSYPTYIFLNSQGEIIHRGMDGMKTDEFIGLGETAMDTLNNFKAIAARVKNGDRTPETLTKYFDFIPYSDEKEALSIEYLNQLTKNEKLSETAWAFFRDYIQNIHCEPFRFFAKNTKLFINQFGEERVEKKMVNLFKNSYKENKNYFESLRKYNPTFYKQVKAKLNDINY